MQRRPGGQVQVELHFFFNLGARWGWAANDMARPLYPRGKEPVPPPQLEPRALQPVASRYTNYAIPANQGQLHLLKPWNISLQFSPSSCHFFPLRSKYSPQHPVLEHARVLQINKLDQCASSKLDQCTSSSLTILRNNTYIWQRCNADTWHEKQSGG